MKTLRLTLSLVIVSIILVSCGKAPRQTEFLEAAEETAPSDEAQVVLANDPRKIGPAKPQEQLAIEENIYNINSSENPLYGYWVGSFGKNKINLAIAHVDGETIRGHSVCAGNFRAISGTIKKVQDSVYAVTMREPGDDQYDGEFKFTIDLRSNQLSGSWKPYKNTVSSKTYTLTKRAFVYDATVGDYPEASTEYLQVPDVENLLPEEIELRRNEIYARHGYSFTNLKIRRIFDEKEWYIPMGIDIRDQLTEIEAHNIDLFLNYEDYYEDYYNDYGR